MSAIRRALVSVTNKTGIVDFVSALQREFGVEVLSTGGTFKVLQDAGLEVISVDSYTGFPEMMDGRVKTLHPKIHGALLAKRSNSKHMKQASEHEITPIDLVVVNLYEFEKTIAQPDVTLADAIENIDIGGPSMLRSAAKNNESVTVVCDISDYNMILEEMRTNNGETLQDTRLRLAAKVFTTTAAYDAAIAQFISQQAATSNQTNSLAFDEVLDITLSKKQELRYGENPHQNACVYSFNTHKDAFTSAHSLVNARQIQGKPLSYNNLLDADAAWSCVRDMQDASVVILKHQNPCGSATASDVVTAYDKAYACDPVSAFGGIIAVNQEVPLELCEHFADVNKQFVEVIIAPSYTPEALERLSSRKNLRVLATGGVGRQPEFEMRSIDGGVLIQKTDMVQETPDTFDVVTARKPTEQEMSDLLFGWNVCKSVKSNAILIAKNNAGIGMGPGQPNRVDSALLACDRAHAACERMRIAPAQLTCASDAFFPFRDTIDVLATKGVTAIIQPGGSIRDEEVIEACNEHGIAMVFTHIRHFRH